MGKRLRAKKKGSHCTYCNKLTHHTYQENSISLIICLDCVPKHEAIAAQRSGQEPAEVKR